jgi:hypothetical protein
MWWKALILYRDEVFEILLWILLQISVEECHYRPSLGESGFFGQQKRKDSIERMKYPTVRERTNGRHLAEYNVREWDCVDIEEMKKRRMKMTERSVGRSVVVNDAQ